MITSKDNEKLKLVRRLAQRQQREREGLFASEGEDLVAAGRAVGREPLFTLVAAGSGLEGEEVEPALLAGVSGLGSGTRAIAVWKRVWDEGITAPAIYLHALADPANVGTVIRSVDALVGGTVVIGPGCADPFSPKAVRASMGSVFGVALVRGGVGEAPTPRVGLVAHGGEEPWAGPAPATLCIGAEREGLPEEVLRECESHWTIPLRPGGAESLNVAAAAAIALRGISSAAAEGRVG